MLREEKTRVVFKRDAVKGSVAFLQIRVVENRRFWDYNNRNFANPNKYFRFYHVDVFAGGPLFPQKTDEN